MGMGMLGHGFDIDNSQGWVGRGFDPNQLLDKLVKNPLNTAIQPFNGVIFVNMLTLVFGLK
jgi:hypothetical protein